MHSTHHSNRIIQNSSAQSAALILLIGLPGSGKSTIAAKLLQQSRGQVISTDAIRAQLFGNESVQGPWLKVWREVGRQFWHVVPCIAAGKLDWALYDATNAVRRQRRQAIVLARTSGFTHVTGLWLNTPLALCLERNQQRSRHVPIEVIQKMHRCLIGAPPALDEGFDQLVEIKREEILGQDVKTTGS
ncbi:AAA family ATPase [Leptolyngbya sp. FACHB-36]|uniref:AAA family ATPase n=1 Tax=Leptolyngbya sp. FACHB-36 TaxID=2692808 RepID=UPI00168155C8|nr:AAA family ATPase [Leptolyngbya sp. FACHB-36]MBD2021402.1 AAA family ATPase [Leptolyngbya sp. FACHB-36]